MGDTFKGLLAVAVILGIPAVIGNAFRWRSVSKSGRDRTARERQRRLTIEVDTARERRRAAQQKEVRENRAFRKLALSRRRQGLSGNTSREIASELRASGCAIDRQKGSHQIWKCPPAETVVLPIHRGRDVSPGVARSIRKQIGVRA